ncbi:MAG: MMPL family transporter, partial [Acutalibacteraceae bacterium]
MIVKLSKWVVRHTNLIIIVALVLLVPSLIGFVLTPVNYDILSILPNQDEPGDIEDSNSIYGIDIIDEVFQSSSISVVIMEDLSPKEMDRICEDVNEVKGVSQAIWVGSVADIGIPESMYPDALKEMLYSEKDGHKSTLMLVQYEPDDPDERDYDSIAKVRAVKEVLDSEHCFVYGLSAVMDDTKAIIESEMFIYIAVAIGLATLVIFATTKQWLMPLVIVATLGCGVAYNMGTNFVLGDISYITQAIAAILQMAVTIDYSIILLDRFEEEIAKTTNVKKAMAKAVSYSFTSLIGGASTTFFGFIALCFMSLTLGLDIGIVMAKGIVFGLLSVLIIMPALILKFYKYIFKYEHKRFQIKYDRLVDFVIKHKKVL